MAELRFKAHNTFTSHRGKTYQQAGNPTAYSNEEPILTLARGRVNSHPISDLFPSMPHRALSPEGRREILQAIP